MFRSRVSWPIALMFWFSCVVAAVHGFMCTTLSSIDSFTLFSFFLNPILTCSRWRRLWPLPSLPSGFYLLRVWLHRWLSGDEEEKLVSACSVLVNNEQACQIGFMLTTGETPAPRHTGTGREGGGRESHKNPSVQRHTTQRSHIQPYISFVLRINVFFLKTWYLEYTYAVPYTGLEPSNICVIQDLPNTQKHVHVHTGAHAFIDKNGNHGYPLIWNITLKKKLFNISWNEVQLQWNR